MMARPIDTTKWLGQQVGRLTVKEFIGVRPHGPSRKNRSVYRSECLCGNEYVISHSALEAGMTKSCGCLRSINKLARRTPKQRSGVNTVFSSYRANARQKNLTFDLTRDEVEGLISKPCFYCGICRSNNRQVGNSQDRVKYNGIDRVDSTKGYTLDNVVTCCRQCNYGKLRQSPEEFIDWARRVVAYQEGKILSK